jgi:hypothetical protein
MWQARRGQDRAKLTHEATPNPPTSAPHARLIHPPGKSLQDAVEAGLRAVNLWNNGVADKQARQYSGGMKRRLSVAISFMGDPLVVYLDEPSTVRGGGVGRGPEGGCGGLGDGGPSLQQSLTSGNPWLSCLGGPGHALLWGWRVDVQGFLVSVGCQ